MHHPRLWAFIILVITALSSAQDAVDDPKEVLDAQCVGSGGMLGAEEERPLCSTVYLPYGHNCGVGSYTAKFPCVIGGVTSYLEVLTKCCCQPCKALSCPKRCELKYADESYTLLSKDCSDVAPNNGEVPFTRKTNMKQPMCIDPCPKYKYLQRILWCAEPVKLTTKFAESPRNVYVYQTGPTACPTEHDCKTRVRGIQADNVNNNKVDIAYNFLIGGDGNAYVGRGWNYVGEHDTDVNINKDSIGVTFIGDFTTSDPDEAFTCALRKLVAFGMMQNKIPDDVRQWCICSTSSCTPQKFECSPVTWKCNCISCSCDDTTP